MNEQNFIIAGNGEVASLTPGTGIKSCGCFLPDLTRFTF